MAKDRVRTVFMHRQNAGKKTRILAFLTKNGKNRTKFYPKGFFLLLWSKTPKFEIFFKTEETKLSVLVHCHLDLCFYPAYLAIKRFFITCMQMLQSKMQQIEIQSLTCLVFIFNLTTYLSNIRNTVSMQSFLSFSFWISY